MQLTEWKELNKMNSFRNNCLLAFLICLDMQVSGGLQFQLPSFSLASISCITPLSLTRTLLALLKQPTKLFLESARCSAICQQS